MIMYVLLSWCNVCCILIAVVNEIIFLVESRDSSVGIAAGKGWTACVRIFLLSTKSRPAVGPTLPPIQLVYYVPSLGVKL
jgi:hypothetical protein